MPDAFSGGRGAWRAWMVDLQDALALMMAAVYLGLIAGAFLAALSGPLLLAWAVMGWLGIR